VQIGPAAPPMQKTTGGKKALFEIHFGKLGEIFFGGDFEIFRAAGHQNHHENA
jgi:hypothetical protein